MSASIVTCTFRIFYCEPCFYGDNNSDSNVRLKGASASCTW